MSCSRPQPHKHTHRTNPQATQTQSTNVDQLDNVQSRSSSPCAAIHEQVLTRPTQCETRGDDRLSGQATASFNLSPPANNSTITIEQQAYNTQPHTETTHTPNETSASSVPYKDTHFRLCRNENMDKSSSNRSVPATFPTETIQENNLSQNVLRNVAAYQIEAGKENSSTVEHILSLLDRGALAENSQRIHGPNIIYLNNIIMNNNINNSTNNNNINNSTNNVNGKNVVVSGEINLNAADTDDTNDEDSGDESQ
ncbi:putative uncharacterized protein DDB_G0282133 [Physella acuta]|uniref:putative uncharacterized protein DDB_G0282133 n=1 Tax=Physella acuta TaxID=109671 RepID=UPI0027DBBE8A|nr:putative uncharacterized protein DDB_G0282133 [Physella acuta]